MIARMESLPERLVVAIGGNATHPENIRGTTEEQEMVAARAARSLLPLLMLDNKIVLTHGNGVILSRLFDATVKSRLCLAPVRLQEVEDAVSAAKHFDVPYQLIVRRQSVQMKLCCDLCSFESHALECVFRPNGNVCKVWAFNIGTA